MWWICVVMRLDFSSTQAQIPFFTHHYTYVTGKKTWFAAAYVTPDHLLKPLITQQLTISGITCRGRTKHVVTVNRKTFFCMSSSHSSSVVCTLHVRDFIPTHKPCFPILPPCAGQHVKLIEFLNTWSRSCISVPATWESEDFPLHEADVLIQPWFSPSGRGTM